MYLMMDFPGLAREGFQKTSEPTPEYNCIAWADRDQENWWWPSGSSPSDNEKNAYWPVGTPRKLTIPAFVQAFRNRGFKRLTSIDTSLAPNTEKIAIYALRSNPTHAARQLVDGGWTHKLGQDIDITANLTAVEGEIYGKVVVIMQRPRVIDNENNAC